ncbi:MarR family transcriptional regulator [Kitasatospora sp. YST-16]|uniref:MarR family winged helix-turn-helix transcriptional regulator n=1 Tax=Kitasatospora sp. YST-16 TaxID=2998080 RepID=UPI0022847421|nr:MarR family transcriptional regulator [Kitasatospora sp. YST-16]WAL71513.1 MarR family transcriptional regulator [Kitasatospora sp. YST-16]WNW37553.1 MarR family transcriptional regulator [Streptomyces sp. Li-HN-5-13]
MAHPSPSPEPRTEQPAAERLAAEHLAAELRAAISGLVRAGRPHDQLAPIPATVLDLLDRQGPMTTAELAASRGVRHQTMAATVKELTEAGHLTAGPHPDDARKKVLTLTTQGRNAIEADRRQRVGLLARALTASLDESERLLLARALPLLDRIATELGATDDAGDADGAGEASTAGSAGRAGDRGPISGAW